MNKRIATNADGVPKEAYESPRLSELGYVHAETKQLCVLGKTFGGSDGFGHIPIQACS